MRISPLASAINPPIAAPETGSCPAGGVEGDDDGAAVVGPAVGVVVAGSSVGSAVGDDVGSVVGEVGSGEG